MVSLKPFLSAICLYSLLVIATADCASDLKKEIGKDIPKRCKNQTGDEAIGCAINSGAKISKIPESCTKQGP
ncbi:hypothetical protein FE257_003048 [Aspergillus nanangensis]|uniref:Uncharacterized protein n=1 Tax=Aspergillus nanangensis TaxID=2582783 RepID=A0AAD4CC15_ASPNN|nr:hypothetical protein FE257_003048 [Aspergillus nanangensis]